MNIVAIIPARYGSTRFRGKPLAAIHGKPMIQWVYENVVQCGCIDRVIVATDNEDIAAAVKDFRGEFCMTSSTHATGTDRIAEVAGTLDARLIVNVQGDEPLLPPEAIRLAVTPLMEDESIPMGTLKTKLHTESDIADPHIVKVVTDSSGFALYFSRAPIPCVQSEYITVDFFKHIGLYVYRKDFLCTFAGLAQSPLEKAERLEQLRVLENGYPIKVVETDSDPVGVDVPDDIARVERLLQKQIQGDGS